MARDFEAVRKALGGEKMNFLGASYGIQLGATYAELFRNNYRTMALDAILDHSMPGIATLIAESSTYETEMRAFASWCASTPDCAIHDRNVTELFTSLISQANTSPIPAPGCVQSGTCHPNVTGEDILFSAQPMLVFKDPVEAALFAGWNGLSVALLEAASGNATLLSSPLATSKADPLYPDIAILCNDWYAGGTKYSDLLYKQQITNITSPITRGASQTLGALTRCIGFLKPVINPPRYAHVQNGESLPVLLMHSKKDPECSPEWAVNVQPHIEKSVLLWRDGDGHTSYNLYGQTSKAIEAYLVNQTLPVAGTVYGS